MAKRTFFNRQHGTISSKSSKSSQHTIVSLPLMKQMRFGKSSLVQAGVITQLRQGTWLGIGKRLDFILSRPGSDPFAELTLQGLPDTSAHLIERVQAWRDQHPEKDRLVLIIDQFEEVWTL